MTIYEYLPDAAEGLIVYQTIPDNSEVYNTSLVVLFSPEEAAAVQKWLAITGYRVLVCWVSEFGYHNEWEWRSI